MWRTDRLCGAPPILGGSPSPLRREYSLLRGSLAQALRRLRNFPATSSISPIIRALSSRSMANEDVLHIHLDRSQLRLSLSWTGKTAHLHGIGFAYRPKTFDGALQSVPLISVSSRCISFHGRHTRRARIERRWGEAVMCTALEYRGVRTLMNDESFLRAPLARRTHAFGRVDAPTPSTTSLSAFSDSISS